MKIPHPLKAFRENHSPPLSQEQLAGLLGVSRVTVTRWESGTRKIHDEKLPLVAKKTGIAPAKLRPDLSPSLCGFSGGGWRMNNALTRAQWAARISKTWHGGATTMVDAIIAVARDLEEAKEELGYGEFMLMFEKEEVPFGYERGRVFRRISENSKILESHHDGILPPDWNTLYLLTRLAKKTPDLFDELVANGTINSAMSRGDVAKILRLMRVAEDEQRVLNLVPIVGKFRTLVLDPAWEYDWLSIAGRAKPGYAMQSIEQLRELDIKQWADEAEGCQLYCWVTNNFMAEACKLVAHWGFQHRTLITWIKPPPFGLGSYFRNSTEHVLFATLGDTTTRPAAASMPTHFEAPRGEHSEKPEKFYDIVRAASYPPYGEGNQREPRPDFANLFAEVHSEAAE